MKTFLVTGGAGFIGSNFVLYMLKKHNDIRICNMDKLTYAGNLKNLCDVENCKNHIFIEGDICDTVAVQNIFDQYKIDYVVNFAAESHVDRSIKEPDIFVRTNVQGTVNLLNIAKNNWHLGSDTFRENTKFLQVSTDEVYGSLGPTGYFTESTPLDPHSPYAASKASADLFVQAYADTYKLPVNITRCSNNYGPFQFPEKLIPLIINNTLLQKELPIYGDGMQVRDWLYVADHCRAIESVLFDGKPGEVYNIGGHNEFPNIEIVHRILAYIRETVDPRVGVHLIRYVEDRKGHDRRYGIDPEKIKSDLGWEPTTKFEDGIKHTINWYLQNKSWMEDVTSGAYQMYYKQMYNK